MKEKGITLIALIVTIIILIILAGITIVTLTGEDGIINNANNAKEETEIANEKEVVDRATINTMGNNKRGNIVRDELQDELDRITKVGDTEVEDTGKEFNVVFVNTQRYYTVNKDGDIIEEGKIVVDKSPGDITKDENGNDIEEGKPYEIWSIEDLVAFSNMVNGSGIILQNGSPIEVNTSTSFINAIVELKTNLNFKSKHSYANSERIDFGDINGNENDGNILINEMTTGTGFKPISLNGNFAGTFEGNENTISNIYENREGKAGLFIIVANNTVIQNLSITGTIEGTDISAGIVAGDSVIRNIIIDNCKNHVNIKGITMVGGICGWIKNVTIKNCENYGDIFIKSVSISYGGAGGIAGYINSSGNIDNCYNKGEISGNYICGGIIGTR